MAKIVRNKTSHLDIPHLIQVLGRDERFVGWYQEDATEERVFGGRSWWGSFFHKTQDLVAAAFLTQAREHIGKLVAVTSWGAGPNAFEGQREIYDDFFRYPWSMEDQVKSLNKIISGKIISGT